MDSEDSSLPEVNPELDALTSVTQLIQHYIMAIDKTQKELSEQKQMLQDSFGNDPTYREHDEKVKEATKVRNATKTQILKQPTLMQLQEKVKDLQEQVKEAKQALSDYLQQYEKLTGSRQIEDGKGEIREIVYMAKLVKISSLEGKKPS